MNSTQQFEVIIVGGSYAGLSAAMALGRSLRKVLVIDSGKPCNRFTPHSHNFLTQDGRSPGEISVLARQQVAQYPTVQFHQGIAIRGAQTEQGFRIVTEAEEVFTAERLIFATGVKDLMPAVNGFAECWGISILHCPYCHGYEVRHQTTGIFGNGEYGFEFSKMIRHWTDDLSLFTNGPSTLTEVQTRKLAEHNVSILEQEIQEFVQQEGKISAVRFQDGSEVPVAAMYARAPFVQHCAIPEALGCATTEEGYLQVDPMQQTSVPGVFACGDNTTFMRSVANAVAAGNTAGAVLNKTMIEAAF